MSRLGMSVSDTTILRSIKEADQPKARHAPVRVVGIDEWAWRKGLNYGTNIVDLEQRQVVGLLADRSTSSSIAWFIEHPELEVISRDRAGVYADAARQDAPQARQIADRFHILKNLRETIERQLGTYEAPIRKTDVHVKDIDTKEIPLLESSDRRFTTATEGPPVMAPKPSTPAYFGTFLAASWAEGTTKVRHLFSDIRRRGYTGSFSHLARFVAPWRQASLTKDGVAEHSSDEDAPAPARLRTPDPATGQQISPLTAAALCVKPRGLMTERQLASVDVLKAASTDFCTMRHLAMRLRGLLRGGTVEALNTWLTDARSSNIHGMRRFARTVRQDMAAVTNAVLEPWSNGQAEGQINRLKMIKRAMYGRAGVNLLRARMFPFVEAGLQRE